MGKVQHLNYCRGAIKQIDRMLAEGRLPQDELAVWGGVRALIQQCVKFILPADAVGILSDNKELRGLSSASEVRLPYPKIALELSVENPEPNELGFLAPKTVVVAWETDEFINFTSLNYLVKDGPLGWGLGFESRFLKVGAFSKDEDGFTVVSLLTEKAPGHEKYNHELADQRAMQVLVGFLNMLSCSNVHIERSAPKHEGRKVKSAYPFDTYHILTVGTWTSTEKGGTHGGGSHRSPREHLRRGHIRRCTSGVRTWVNAAIVAAGRGGGVVRKDYAVAANG